MNDEIVNYKIAEHDEKLKEHDKMLDEHEHKINDTNASMIRLADSVDNLSKNVEKGFSLMKWFIGLFAAGIIGFFFYMIQSLF